MTAPIVKSVKEFQTKTDAYFKSCDENKKAYTITGLALFLGYTSTGGLNDISTRGKDFEDILIRAKLRVEESLAQRLMKPGQPIAGIIFNLKNNFGWTDRQDHEITGKGGKGIEIIYRSNIED